MFVKAAYARFAKKDAATTIGLQPVLVRIDHDGVGLRKAGKRACRLFARFESRMKYPP